MIDVDEEHSDDDADNNDYTNEKDDDDDDTDEENINRKWADSVMAKTEIRSEARKIILKCEQISSDLRKSLKSWATTSTTTGGDQGATANQPKDCLNFTAMIKQPNNGNGSTSTSTSSSCYQPAAASSTATGKLLSDEDISALCHNLILKPYQLVCIIRTMCNVLHQDDVYACILTCMNILMCCIYLTGGHQLDEAPAREQDQRSAG